MTEAGQLDERTKASQKCPKSSLFTRLFSPDMNIVQVLKIKLHFKYFCKFVRGEYQRDESSTEHTKLTGTHSETEGSFQLAENLETGIKRTFSPLIYMALIFG